MEILILLASGKSLKFHCEVDYQYVFLNENTAGIRPYVNFVKFGFQPQLCSGEASCKGASVK